MSKKAFDNLLSSTNQLTSSWKSKLIYTSPVKRPNSRTALPNKLQQYCKAKVVSHSKQQPQRQKQPVCKQCVLLLRMQSSLSQQLAEKEIRLSKCLKFIDELIQESDVNRAKLRVVEEENAKLVEKMRMAEGFRSDPSYKELTTSSKTVVVSKVSEPGKITTAKKDQGKTKANDKLAILEKQNNRLKVLVEELENDKKKLTNMKQQADRNHQFMQSLHNSFKARYFDQSQSKSKPQGRDTKMEQELKQLRQRCIKLQSAIKDNLHQSRQGTTSTTIPSLKIITEENHELKQKLTEIKTMYQQAERGRIKLQSKIQKERELEKQKLSLSQPLKGKNQNQAQLKQAVSHLHQQILKWQQVIVEKDQAILALQKQAADRLDQIQNFKDKIEQSEDLKYKVETGQRLIMTLTNDLNVFKKENQCLRDQLSVQKEHVKGLTQDHTNDTQSLEAEVSKLAFEVNQLKFKNKKLAAIEASSVQKVLMLQDKIKQQQKANQQMERSYKAQQDRLVQLLKQARQQLQLSKNEVDHVHIETDGLKESVDRLENQMEFDKEKYELVLETHQGELETAKQTIIELETELKETLDIVQKKNAEIIKLQQQIQKLKNLPKSQILKNEDYLDQLVAKEMRINELNEQNQRLSQMLGGSQISLFKYSTSFSTNPSELESIVLLKDNLSKLKIENDELINSVYERDLRISDLCKRLSEPQKTIEALETVHSDEQEEV